MNEDGGKVLVSVVTPVYRGASFLPRLVEALEQERERWRQRQSRIELAEALFVLDGPIDHSAEVLEDLVAARPWMRVIELSKNYGQHSATVAGILHTTGDWVVTLDEDMQHDPAYIAQLLHAAVEARADIVYAMPEGQVHGGWRDRFSRRVKSAVARLSGNPEIARFNSFRLIRGQVARAASSICAQHTYLDLALAWHTDRTHSLTLDMRDERAEFDRSGYSFWGLVQHAKRLLLSSELHVLRFAFSVAAIAAVTAVVYGAWIVYRRFFSEWGYEVAGWPSLAIMILLFGAGGVFLLGLLLEFVQVMVLQLQGKPAFFVVDRAKDTILTKEIPRLLDRAEPIS